MLDKHPYLPNSSSVLSEMLKEAGVGSIDELFSDVPDIPFRIEGIQAHPMDELQLVKELREILGKNRVYGSMCFTGGGPWMHYVPSVIGHIISRGEFLTAYTPYQAEISQGILQALFEYQSLICELYGMEAANASMYDLPTAVGEAALLCTRVTGRRVFVIPAALPWERKSVIRNYTEPQGIELREAPYSPIDGTLDREGLNLVVDEHVSGVYMESPSYFGTVDKDMGEAAAIAHDAGALAVAGADPLSLGIFKPPGEYGADIAVGDGQPLGLPPGFGGNGLGIMACNSDRRIMRQMPGKIVGLTKTKDRGRDGYVLALATREQHIRRELATSNICTNGSLLAIAAAVYLTLMGKDGMQKVGMAIARRTAYARNRMNKVGLETPFGGISFRDFVVQVKDAQKLSEGLARKGFSCGRDLSKDFPDRIGSMLFAVTEMHTHSDIDALADAAGEAAGVK